MEKGFDSGLFGALLGVLKSIPGTAVSQSAANAERAEAAAENAIEHGYGVSVSNTTLTFTDPTNG